MRKLFALTNHVSLMVKLTICLVEMTNNGIFLTSKKPFDEFLIEVGAGRYKSTAMTELSPIL